MKGGMGKGGCFKKYKFRTMPNSVEKKLTNAEEFISNFQGESGSIENSVINDNVYVRRVNYKIEKLFLKDVHFKGQLFFDNCDLKDGIKFINCEFENYLVFHSCLSKKKNYDFLPGDKSIEFVNCRINFDIDIRNSKFEGGIVFNNCILEKVYFEQLIISDGGGIEFRNQTVVNHSIWVTNCNFLKGGIRLTESTFNGALRFENNTLGSYDLTFSNFAKNIFIWAGYCNSISFYQSQFEDDFNLQAVKVKDELSIIENVFKKSFRIQLDEENGSKRGNLSHVYLSQSDFLNDFSLKQFDSKKTAINKIIGIGV